MREIELSRKIGYWLKNAAQFSEEENVMCVA